MSRHPAPTLPAEQLSAAWQSASLLLGYPDERLLGDLPLVRRAAGGLPPPLAAPLLGVVDELERTPGPELEVDYVETFDNRRRCNLYLTYFTHGDTRKRGLALLRFKQTYLRSGFVLDASPAEGEELPDHLCVVLEYAATVDQRLGWKLLLDHRASLELLRLSLRDSGSRWTGAVEAVCATLPRVRADERDLVRKLVEEGPPAEEVGLTPYGEPTFDPLVSSAAGGAR
ncbi:MAG TPA: nitrate reductase molybdenum cofactor assembly chaperone [Marmoricola sp.]|jgi:nitrate reductase delta subunit|nr:nitrate reductase molybdenum cofactor assembly chaperone [Marmoricola sp.]